MKKAAVLINTVNRQFEGLMTCMGLQLNDIQVTMIVLHHEIDGMDDAYHDNMIFFEEMGGERYSDNPANVEKHGFKSVNIKDMVALMKVVDHVIPF